MKRGARLANLCAVLPLALEGAGGWLALNEFHKLHLVDGVKRLILYNRCRKMGLRIQARPPCDEAAGDGRPARKQRLEKKAMWSTRDKSSLARGSVSARRLDRKVKTGREKGGKYGLSLGGTVDEEMKSQTKVRGIPVHGDGGWAEGIDIRTRQVLPRRNLGWAHYWRMPQWWSCGGGTTGKGRAHQVELRAGGIKGRIRKTCVGPASVSLSRADTACYAHTSLSPQAPAATADSGAS